MTAIQSETEAESDIFPTISRSDLELHVLKKWEPTLTELADSAPFVATYRFDFKRGVWEKLKCEGVLFLYKKLNISLYHMFILNRLGDQYNMIETIYGNETVYIHEPYLLFQNCHGVLYGLWFHDNACCTKIGHKVLKLVNNQRPTDISAPNIALDAVSMLKPSEHQRLNKDPVPSLDVANFKDQVTSPSVANFFATVTKSCSNIRRNSSDCSNNKKSGDNPINGVDDLIRKLKENPKYNVDSIEQQQFSMASPNNYY